MGEVQNDVNVIPDDEFLEQCVPLEEPPPPFASDGNCDNRRLMIERIVNENFKSYGGTKTLGPFHKCFTCIIGPNGSGKSNVIDSMLFVFGFRSQRIRSKKLSSLIHKSEAFPDIQSCSVSVYFQNIIDTGPNANDYEVVPDSEFFITRKASVDGSSNYYINDRRSNFKEVGNILRSRGVDLDHNRFLILQGEVEQIAMMKPKAPTEHEDGFLEYLEPLKILSSRIERLSEIRVEKLARVKVVEKECQELEGVRNEAIRYLKLCNKITALKNKLWQKFALLESNERDSLQKKLEAEIKTELTAKLHDSHKLRTEREKVNQEYDSYTKQATEKKDKLSKLSGEDAKLADEWKHTKSVGKTLHTELQGEEEKLQALIDFPATAAAKKEELLESLKKLQSTKSSLELVLEEAIKNLEDETQPLRTQIESLEKSLAPLQSEADDCKSKYEIAKQEFDLKLSAKHRELEKANRTKAQLEEYEQQLTNVREQLSTAEMKLNPKTGLAVQVQKTRRDLSDITKQEVIIKEEVNKLRSKLMEIKSTMSYGRNNRVLNSLLEACRTGELTGIVGRLGDLGAIPKEYDVAISTACGALDNIVAETMNDAQAAVNFLKKYNLGQATFIGLDKMERFTDICNQPFKQPDPETPRLFDLITHVDERFKTAFYYALRDTLVAPNLDKATAIAFQKNQRYRVVSMKGELVEVSGAMSGGGNRCMHGRMCMDISSARKSLNQSRRSQGNTSLDEENMEDKISENLKCKQTELSTLLENKSRMEEVLTNIQRQLTEAEGNIARYQKEVPKLQQGIQRAKDEIKSFEKRAADCGPSDSEIKSSEKSLSKMKQGVDAKKAKAEKLVNNIDQLNDELKSISEEKISTKKNKVRTLETKIKDVHKQINKLEVDVSTHKKHENKCKEKIESLKTELDKMRDKMDGLFKSQKELEVVIRESLASFNDVQRKVEEIESSRKALHEECEKLQVEIDNLKSEEAKKKREIDDVNSQIQDKANKYRAWMSKVRSLELHKLDEDVDLDVLDEDQLSIIAISANIASLEESKQKNDMNGTQNESKISVSINESKKIDRSNLGRNGLRVYHPNELLNFEMDTSEINRLEQQVKDITPNIAAIEVYKTKTERYIFRVNELNEITDVIDQQRQQFEDFKLKRLTEFVKGFNQITTSLKEMYRTITLGGDAELEMIDSLDPFSEGITFSVRPPNKSWKNISNLSGGEKTLSSLAFVFALHHYRPTPLYVMDEIDAALDFKNVSIVGNYLKERTKNAQFVIISLRSNMFELADLLVGIYKLENITFTIVLDPHNLTNKFKELIQKIKINRGITASSS